MMRILLALGIVALAIACAQKDTGKSLNKLSGRTTANDARTIHSEEDESADSSFYIGYVDYFPETKEFYTTLFYREGHEYPDADLLESRLDSVIVYGDDWGRERLPMADARKMLVLSGLDSIAIYNRRHELICISPLARVEYLWDGLESNFIAVFQTDGRHFEQTEELYGVSASLAACESAGFADVEVKDALLNEFLMKKMGFSRSVEWDMRHYLIEPAQTTISIVSSYSMESDKAFSYLTAMENNEVRIMNEEVDNFHFLSILPVPIMINGRPLLLISAGYPSSDVIWDYLAWYDGAKYDPVDYNRVHVKNLRSDLVFFTNKSDLYQ